MNARRRPARGTAADLWAGLAGGVFAPISTFGLGLPLWAALPGAVLVFLGLRLALTPPHPVAGSAGEAADAAGFDLAREVLASAQADLDRLRDAALGVRDASARRQLDRLHGVASRAAGEVAREPQRLSSVRRLLTYYLPAAARLGEGYRTLEAANAPDRARVAAAGAMIARLDTVFARHADRLASPEMEALDVELKLLNDALRVEERGEPERPADPMAASEPSPWR